MLFNRFVTIIKTLADLPQGHTHQPFVLVYNVGLEAWALLDLDTDLDKLQFFDDPRNAALCVITGNDLPRLPVNIDLAKCAEALRRYMIASARPPGQVAFHSCFNAEDVTTPTQEKPTQ